DVYCLFYEQGFNLLRQNGVLAFITSNKWMRAGYGKSLRSYFTKVNTLRIINLGPHIFHSATVDTNIFLGKKEAFNNTVKGVTVESRFSISLLKDADFIPMRKLSGDAWVVLEESDLKIARAFEQYGRPLREWSIKVNFGIKTGLNEAYLI